jgi:outer membrane protein OmpA-like peptidoglycan-associated protein
VASPGPAPIQAPEKAPAPGAAPVSGVVDALAHFDFDSAELTEAGRDTLDAWLAQAPVGMPVVISGYADRLGPEPYNVDLSLRRAMAARDYLVSRGKDVRDIRIHARGETHAVKHCKGGPTPSTKACLAPNRRVEISPE